VRAALALLMAGGRTIPKAVAKASSGRGESVISRLVGEVRKMPPETWPMVRAHWCTPKSFLGMAAYLEGLPASAREAAGLRVKETIPVIVLSANHATPEEMEEREEWARHSLRGKHIVARASGHWIQLDEPELVVEAIREAVQQTMPETIRPS
jgi:pimeloyl-ACP methyl ester carboxylesterase